MSQLFEDSDTEIEIKTNNEYAKSYDTWRKKEELHKFEARYGGAALEDEIDEDSSEDDETAVELTEEVEKDFYRTLALLKKKDPKIYDDKVVFFKDSNEKKPTIKADKKKTMSLKDYERQLLLENGGILSDDENEDIKENTMNWKMEEENQLKKSFRVMDEESDEDIGSLLKAREKTKEVNEKEEADYKAWLTGQKEKLKDEEIASSLKHLKDYWNNPELEEGEKFLRDCLLNNRYLETESKDYIPTYDEIVQDLSEEEDEIEKQEEFEHKYNFRFEDPDQDFIKRYPRTIEGSLRKEDNRRKLKRQEVKERKVKEKEEKMEELRKLRDMKRKEIEEKIEKLKEITGNQEIAFNDEDIDGDFDPEAHDKRMQALFNDDYYEDGPEENIKPPIDLDDADAIELQPENYDNWTGNNEEEIIDAPHCEDDDFNMDAEYDPKATQKELVDSTRKKKKRKRKSKFVEMLAKDRPKFDPLDAKYEKYVDEYYKFDCEDIIDDIPFKFKYRKVVPNNFGLSVEEILLANDRELNKWCSLKKAVSLRDDHVEKYEQIAYEKKGQNIQLKKKVIPSLFIEEGENEMEAEGKQNSESKAINGKKVDRSKEKVVETIDGTETTPNTSSNVNELPDKKRKRKSDPSQEIVDDGNSNEDNLNDQPKKKKKKKNLENKQEIKTEIPDEVNSKKKKKKHNKEGNVLSSFDSVDQNEEILDNLNNSKKISKKMKKRKEAQNKANINNTNMENQEESSIRQNLGHENIEEQKSSINQKSLTIKRKHSEISNQQKSTKKSKKNKKDVGIGPSIRNNLGHDNIKEQKSSLNQKSSVVKTKHSEISNEQKSTKKSKKNKKDVDIGISDSRIMVYGWNPKKYKNKLIYGSNDKNE